MKEILLVGCGGFIGAIMRYAAAGWIQRLREFSSFPFGTLSVNLTGCLIIGLLGGLADHRELFSSSTRLFLLVGMLGSFTTFSTFGYETLALIRDQQLLLAFGNVASHLIMGLFAVWLGYTLSQWI